MPGKRKKPILGRDPVSQLYRAVIRYVEARGGKLVVIGGIEVQDWGEGRGKFRVAVRCLGRAPELAPERALIEAAGGEK